MRFCSLLALLSLAGLAQAQPNIEPKDGKVTIPLTLTPTALPKPLSRFFLTPQYKEMEPGNRIPSYMKAYMEQANFFSKDPSEQRDKWNLTMLEELPLDKVKDSGCVGGLAYRLEAQSVLDNTTRPLDFPSSGRPLSDGDEGSRFLTTDWQIWSQIRRDHIGTLLPEVQKMRELANVLKVRMRYEIATDDFEKAAYTARTYFGLIQAFESHPTLIAGLVGLAIEAICLNAIEEMIQRPGCPNLYWSLMELPTEGLNMRTPIQGEKQLCYSLFGKLLAAKGELPEADVKRMIQQFDTLIFIGLNGDKTTPKVAARFAALVKDAKKVAAARQLLVETGMKADLAKSLPALQVLVTAEARQYEVDLDDLFRAYALPAADAEKMTKEMEARLKDDPDRILSRALLPALNAVRQAHLRLRQRVAYLRVIEAVRLYAQDNPGKLPAQLAAIKLPIPPDPVPLKAFVYSMKDGKAILTGGNSNPGQANTNRVYEIRIRK